MPYKLISVVMAPLLLTQGYLVRKNALKLPEAKGSRTGVAGSGDKKLRLLILGDSAAAGVGVASQSQALSGQILRHLTREFYIDWQLIAASGASTDSIISVLEKLPEKMFDVAVISLGVNDVSANMSMKRCQYYHRRLITLLKKKFAVECIIFSSLPPVHLVPALPQPLRWYLGGRAKRLNNQLCQWLGKQKGCLILKARENIESELMAEDGFHPGEKYYAWWGRQAAGLIQEYMTGKTATADTN
ncbi:SGNH/GDSL hydrolase family protein [Thalassomonas viridans]|uniref:SGNH/GDSL hydrolase family protein n=1 Tax=Thalassomonas viridans TaxID=137584 RepID=A0AAE9ZDH5_9GAMM|nr:SGNH/GDSL hydrolase family protein [Thalassomonas viridans]WDE08597.1 SGNH/GDSL hydrolase family protein [Thalassomonas viridans]